MNLSVTQADLDFISDQTRKEYLALGEGLRLDGMDRPLNERERIVLAYLIGVTDLLYKRGMLSLGTLEIPLLSDDSNTPESDYE